MSWIPCPLQDHGSTQALAGDSPNIRRRPAPTPTQSTPASLRVLPEAPAPPPMEQQQLQTLAQQAAERAACLQQLAALPLSTSMAELGAMPKPPPAPDMPGTAAVLSVLSRLPPGTLAQLAAGAIAVAEPNSAAPVEPDLGESGPKQESNAPQGAPPGQVVHEPKPEAPEPPPQHQDPGQVLEAATGLLPPVVTPAFLDGAGQK